MPPRHLCRKCLAIDQPQWDQYDEDRPARCSVCGVQYIATEGYPLWCFDDYLEREVGTSLRFSDPISHATRLARLARQLQTVRGSRPHLFILNELLLAAEQFVHFVSWGINHSFIGSLKTISHRVPVRGIVSNVNDYTTSELTAYPEESPRFECEVFQGYSAPHTKLIIVDGLVALGGSANLTLESWRKIKDGRDRLTVETNTEKVMRDHNDHFSHIWAQRSHIGDHIQMEKQRAPRWPT
jgi:phosphatidylserine/phosphatidylglycerophosphate/cardiolipin synthase-like enzyme